jgi:tetratricopeptide (TPR) repeat protein
MPLPPVPGHEILGILGRGGMGVVYLARHLALQRLVALKMILAGCQASPEELSRFRTEVQAVAQLQHPNIVQVFEVGECLGMPYCTLEYVNGGSLANLTDGKPQPPKEAAQLVVQLARAVQVAHAQGIVHRDLKPANILLALSSAPEVHAEESPARAFGTRLNEITPKITDFGLAKRIADNSSHTRTGEVIGTPGYMAPEQAAGRTEEVGPVVDVYALGAILYELLTGRPPFQGVTPLETLLMVTGSDPVLPSRLQPKTPRDLETICLKCLHKQPHKRYATAAELAEDLERFLGEEPIRARRSTTWERMVKWGRRRPAVAALLGALVLTIFVGFVGMSLLYWQAQQERDEARQQRQRADENLNQARQAVKAYLLRVTNDPRLRDVDMRALRQELLETALPYLETILHQKGDDPHRQGARAITMLMLADVQIALEEFDKALAMALEAQQIYAKVIPKATTTKESLSAGLTRAYHLAGHALQRLGRPREAEAAYREAITAAQGLIQQYPQTPTHQDALAESWNELGLVLETQGKLAEAEQALEQARRTRTALQATSAATLDNTCSLGGVLNNLAWLRHKRGATSEALQLLDQAIAYQQAALEKHPRSLIVRQYLGNHYYSKGEMLLAQGRRAEGIAALRQCLACRSKLATDFPTVLNHRRQYARLTQHLAGLLGNQSEEVETLYRLAVTEQEYITERLPKEAEEQSELGRLLHNYANALYRRRQPEQAVPFFQRARCNINKPRGN